MLTLLLFVLSISIFPVISSSNATNVTELFYTNCQNSKNYGCFTSSEKVGNCSKTKNCDFGATWIGESENSYKIQLISTAGKDILSDIKDVYSKKAQII